MDILQAQLAARREKRPYALVTLVRAEGATPRGVGSKMIVFADGSARGSVGGGVLERRILPDAAACIRAGTSALKSYENREETDGAPCGGSVTAFIEAVPGAPELVVCGAGHVGGCVARLAATLGYRVTAVDTRDTEMTRENAAAADELVLCEDFYGGIKALETGPEAYFVIATYGHAQDAEALFAALDRDAKYVGMMGSAAKIDAIMGALRKKGCDEERLASVIAPIGLDIGGETPEEIAVSIIAQMQMVRYGRAGRAYMK